jgi:transposase
VKKPSRLIALSFIMVLCLLIYRLAEQRLRQRLQQSKQTIPNQVNKPTDRPTMRWVFQCFEGIELLHIRIDSTFQTRILRLHPLASLDPPLAWPCLPTILFFVFLKLRNRVFLCKERGEER